MSDKYICVCGATYERRLELCPRCNRIGSFRPNVELPNSYISRSEARVVSGSDLLKKGSSRVRLKGIWKVFFPGGVQLPLFGVIWGPPGSGKSSTGIRMTHDWPGDALYCACETGLGPSIQSLMGYLEAYDFMLSCPVSWSQLVDVSRGFDLVVIDSLQRLSLDPGAVRAEFVDNDVTVVCLSQTNSQGDVRGGMSCLHESDVSINMKELNNFQIVKNRFGDLIAGEVV